MLNKTITTDYNDLKIEEHDKIEGVKLINDKINFPISWLNIQSYCEYQIYLNNVKGVSVPDNKDMIKGTEEHKKILKKK